MNLWKYKGYANSIYHKIQSFRIIIQSFSSTLLLDLLLLRYRLTFVRSSKKFGRFPRQSGLSDWKWLRSFVSKIFFLFSSSTSLCAFGIVTFLYASGELSISLCSYFERCLMCLKIINTEWGWKQYYYIYLICFQKWQCRYLYLFATAEWQSRVSARDLELCVVSFWYLVCRAFLPLE